MAKVIIPDLGQSKAILENEGASPLSALLVELMGDVTEKIKDALKARDINTTSLGLSQGNSVTVPTFTNDEITVSIQMPAYWKYVNYGVNGTVIKHGAPNWGRSGGTWTQFHRNILAWIPARGVTKPDKFKNYESFAYAIMQSIKRKGQAPRPFLQDVVNDSLVDFLREPIQKLIGEAIRVNIRTSWQ